VTSFSSTAPTTARRPTCPLAGCSWSAAATPAFRRAGARWLA
jgi:hypothetical protein